MKPYYDQDGVTIYHGDCREIAPSLAFDLVVADPPYGIAHPTDYVSNGRGAKASGSVFGKDYAPVYGDGERFDPTPWISGPSVLWGANYYASRLPDVSGWLLWDKRVQQGVGVNDQADGEVAWTNCVKGVRIFRHMWNGYWRASERGELYHPTQKPVALMRWLLSLKGIPDGTVLDPYCGAGPLLIAAKAENRRAIGIEIEERYCEIAAKRMEQGALPFIERPAPAEQSDLFTAPSEAKP